MDIRTEVREFLSSRRARLTPEQAGLPAYGGSRRVPGLRREEAAMLSGLSVDHHVQLERGNLKGVSESVLNAVANPATPTADALNLLASWTATQDQHVLPT